MNAPKPTADARCQQQQVDDIRSLLRRIDARLEGHANEQATVRDLARIEGLLQWIADSMGPRLEG